MNRHERAARFVTLAYDDTAGQGFNQHNLPGMMIAFMDSESEKHVVCCLPGTGMRSCCGDRGTVCKVCGGLESSTTRHQCVVVCTKCWKQVSATGGHRCTDGDYFCMDCETFVRRSSDHECGGMEIKHGPLVDKDGEVILEAAMHRLSLGIGLSPKARKAVAQYHWDIENYHKEQARTRRSIDVLINGEDGAAKAPSLIDIHASVKLLVAQFPEITSVMGMTLEEIEQLRIWRDENGIETTTIEVLRLKHRVAELELLNESLSGRVHITLAHDPDNRAQTLTLTEANNLQRRNCKPVTATPTSWKGKAICDNCAEGYLPKAAGMQCRHCDDGLVRKVVDDK